MCDIKLVLGLKHTSSTPTTSPNVRTIDSTPILQFACLGSHLVRRHELYLKESFVLGWFQFSGQGVEV